MTDGGAEQSAGWKFHPRERIYVIVPRLMQKQAFKDAMESSGLRDHLMGLQHKFGVQAPHLAVSPIDEPIHEGLSTWEQGPHSIGRLVFLEADQRPSKALTWEGCPCVERGRGGAGGLNFLFVNSCCRARPIQDNIAAQLLRTSGQMCKPVNGSQHWSPTKILMRMAMMMRLMMPMMRLMHQRGPR